MAAAWRRLPRPSATAATTRCPPGGSSSARRKSTCWRPTSGACRMRNDAAGTAAVGRSSAAQGWRNSSERYASASIALHWLMLLLLVAVYATIELRGLFPKGSDPREAMKAWHFMLGLGVFVLVWLRLVLYASAGPVPLVNPPPGRWQALAARLMHVLLYAFMIAMPLLGWLTL